MRAGLLKDIITLQEQEVTDTLGTVKWNDVLTTRARVNIKGGNVVNQYGDIFYALNIEFITHFHVKVNERMHIKYNGDQYRIVSIIPQKEQMQQTIVTEKINE